MKAIKDVSVAELLQPLKDKELERLRKDWHQGLESGPFDTFDIEEIKQQARA